MELLNGIIYIIVLWWFLICNLILEFSGTECGIKKISHYGYLYLEIFAESCCIIQEFMITSRGNIVVLTQLYWYLYLEILAESCMIQEFIITTWTTVKDKILPPLAESCA